MNAFMTSSASFRGDVSVPSTSNSASTRGDERASRVRGRSPLASRRVASRRARCGSRRRPAPRRSERRDVARPVDRARSSVGRRSRARSSSRARRRLAPVRRSRAQSVVARASRRAPSSSRAHAGRRRASRAPSASHARPRRARAPGGDRPPRRAGLSDRRMRASANAYIPHRGASHTGETRAQCGRDGAIESRDRPRARASEGLRGRAVAARGAAHDDATATMSVQEYIEKHDLTKKDRGGAQRRGQGQGGRAARVRGARDATRTRERDGIDARGPRRAARRARRRARTGRDARAGVRSVAWKTRGRKGRARRRRGARARGGGGRYDRGRRSGVWINPRLAARAGVARRASGKGANAVAFGIGRGGFGREDASRGDAARRKDD